MTIDQTTSASPVQPVTSLQERGDERAVKDRKADRQDFLDLVMDTLAAMEVPEDVRRAAGPLILAAHEARMDALDARRVQAERATHAYASMDRAHQDLLAFVKRTTGQFLEINARLHAEREAYAKVRHDVVALCRYAAEHSAELVPLDKLQEAVKVDVPPVELRPVIVSMATDQRFSFGIFELAGQVGATVQRTFLGWSLVVERPRINTLPEPTFLDVDGTPKTASQLHHEGYTLKHLS